MKRESPLEVWRWSLNTEDYWSLNTARHWTACSPAASDKCLKLNSKCYCWLSTTLPLFSPLIQLNIRNRNTLKNQYFYFEIFISSLFLFLMITIWRINSPPCPSFVIFHQNVAFTLIVFFSVLLWSLPSSVWVQLIFAQNGPQSCCVSSLAASQCSRHLSVKISSSVIDVHTKASLCRVFEPVVPGCSLITVEVMNEWRHRERTRWRNLWQWDKDERGVVVWIMAASAFWSVSMTKLQLSVQRTQFNTTIILVWKQRSFSWYLVDSVITTKSVPDLQYVR